MPSAKKCNKCDKHKDRVRAKRCPVCMDAMLAAHDADYVADNAVGCANNHQICVGCVRQLTMPTELCSPTCCGFNYKCPICRDVCCLRASYVLVLLRGSQGAAKELVNKTFGDRHEFDTQRVLVCGCGAKSSDDEESDDEETE